MIILRGGHVRVVAALAVEPAAAELIHLAGLGRRRRRLPALACLRGLGQRRRRLPAGLEALLAVEPLACLRSPAAGPAPARLPRLVGVPEVTRAPVPALVPREEVAHILIMMCISYLYVHDLYHDYNRIIMI